VEITHSEPIIMYLKLAFSPNVHHYTSINTEFHLALYLTVPLYCGIFCNSSQLISIFTSLNRLVTA